MPTEDYMAYNLGYPFSSNPIAKGEWADSTLVPGSADPIIGYLVEYESGVVPEPSSLLVWLLLGAIGVTVANCRRSRNAR
jgi:hypothetical protein